MGRWRLAIGIATITGLVSAVPAAMAAGPPPSADGGLSHQPVCPSAPAGFANCLSEVVTNANGQPLSSSSPVGLTPSDVTGAYNWGSIGTGAGKTIGIVDAYDDPSAASDLAHFSTTFGLPAPNFVKVNQSGGNRYPRVNSGWALEISLDIEWAHAIAPAAKILLVEASSNSFTNLIAAEDTAKATSDYVSNSWGGSEFSSETTYDSHFARSGVSFFVSSGDAGLPAEWPSASPNVISVGGTTLQQDTSGKWTDVGEAGWSSGGGGCSAYEKANAAQSTFLGTTSPCGQGVRATPDVSLDADPASGVAVYDTTSYQGQSGWIQVGGTSASSPMWAARSADASVAVNPALVYATSGTTIAFHDITSGGNSAGCLVGYDMCSGRGSWAGSTP